MMHTKKLTYDNENPNLEIINKDESDNNHLKIKPQNPKAIWTKKEDVYMKSTAASYSNDFYDYCKLKRLERRSEQEKQKELENELHINLIKEKTDTINNYLKEISNKKREKRLRNRIKKRKYK